MIIIQDQGGGKKKKILENPSLEGLWTSVEERHLGTVRVLTPQTHDFRRTVNLTLGALGLYPVSLSSLPSNLSLHFNMATFYQGTKCITFIKVLDARLNVYRVMGSRELWHLGEADISWWWMVPLCPIHDGPAIHHSHCRTEVGLVERFRVKSWP